LTTESGSGGNLLGAVEKSRFLSVDRPSFVGLERVTVQHFGSEAFGCSHSPTGLKASWSIEMALVRAFRSCTIAVLLLRSKERDEIMHYSATTV
jgi:hypothetical protein